MRYRAEIDGHCIELELDDNKDRPVARVGDRQVEVQVARIGTSARYAVLFCERSFEFEFHRNAAGSWVAWAGHLYHCRIEDARKVELTRLAGDKAEKPHEGTLRAPMPGLIVEVRVKVGDVVQRGQGVLVMEAMKMENELRAPCPGRVKEVRVAPRETVEQDQILLVFG
ncbi:MAG: acetyl-CoA carboxylase biotin carboxyl carrier protein subunit [Candidatus Oleimicrobiaceae bacterium]